MDPRLVDRLQSAFDTDEQKVFLESFSMHAQHSVCDFVVDFDRVWSWMGFARKDHGKRVLDRYFKVDRDYIVVSSNIQQQGGLNKEDILLSLDTLETFCMRANTPQAEVVRGYFRKMHRVVMEHLDACKAELSTQIETMKLTSLIDQEAAISAVLVAKSAAHNVFYMAKMQTLGLDDFIFKIGSTEDIKKRKNSLGAKFGALPIFLEVIPTDCHTELESWVKTHTFFTERKYTDFVNDLHKSIECFRGTMSAFETFRDLIKKKSSIMGVTGKMTDIELARVKNAEAATRVDHIRAQVRLEEVRAMDKQTEAQAEVTIARAKLLDNYNLVFTQSLTDPKSVVLTEKLTSALTALQLTAADVSLTHNASHNAPVETSVPNIPPEFTRTPPKVDLRHARSIQRYDVKTLEFIDTFPAMNTALYECGDDTKGSPAGLRKAIAGNHPYLGYRWALVADGVDPQAPIKIAPTVYAKTSRPSLVAKLSPDLSKVVEVYTNQKIAADAEQLKTPSTIMLAIHNTKKFARGHRWMYWCNVASDLQSAYLQTNELPKEFGRAGRSVRQKDAVTDAEICVHDSIGVVCKKFNMGHGTIKKACEQGNKSNGFLWEWA